MNNPFMLKVFSRPWLNKYLKCGELIQRNFRMRLVHPGREAVHARIERMSGRCRTHGLGEWCYVRHIFYAKSFPHPSPSLFCNATHRKALLVAGSIAVDHAFEFFPVRLGVIPLARRWIFRKFWIGNCKAEF